MSALEKQEGGDHYKSLKIQPVEYIHANNIPFIEGCIIKYATRWKDKGGVADLKKIIHFAELLLELEDKKCPWTGAFKAAGEAPWYPDDSGEWVEFDSTKPRPKSHENRFRVIGKWDRDRKCGGHITYGHSQINWTNVVAYKVIK